MPLSESDDSSPRWAAITVGLICVISAGLRLWQARESLWLDELHTAWCAIGPLANVQPRAEIGNQSPLFFWLEWLMVKLLGENDLAVRLPSIVAGSLLTLAMF